MRWTIVCLLLLVGCSSPAPTASIAPSPSPSTSTEVALPADEACHRKTVSVKMDTFNTCILNGMTYVQVANTIGYAGELQSQSGSTELWQWNGGEGKYISAVFTDGKLTSKAQTGLE